MMHGQQNVKVMCLHFVPLLSEEAGTLHTLNSPTSFKHVGYEILMVVLKKTRAFKDVYAMSIC
jgi:hypothetical protein